MLEIVGFRRSLVVVGEDGGLVNRTSQLLTFLR